jgi:hypothetical protein
MRKVAVVLCLLLVAALLTYYGTRQLSISTPPPLSQTSVVRGPGVSARREPAPTPPPLNQVDSGRVEGAQGASDHARRQPTQTENCVAIGGLPDSACTPGDIDRSETRDIVCSHDFHTGTVRDKTTTRTQKNQVYTMYAIAHPPNNTGLGQVCEIDHLVALELGGADTMANLWPECSAGYDGWQGPGFRDKDSFENYLWYHVCVDQDVSLEEAQTEIATNWLKYWEAAGKPECRNRANCK